MPQEVRGHRRRGPLPTMRARRRQRGKRIPPVRRPQAAPNRTPPLRGVAGEGGPCAGAWIGPELGYRVLFRGTPLWKRTGSVRQSWVISVEEWILGNFKVGANQFIVAGHEMISSD